MKIKFSGSNIILSAESSVEARVLQAARANTERKEKMRCSRIWVGDVDSETNYAALTLTLERLRPASCDLDRQHAIAAPVSFPEYRPVSDLTEVVHIPEPNISEGRLRKIIRRIFQSQPGRRDARVGGRN